MNDDSLKHTMIGEFDERLTEIDISIRALASSKSCPSACAGHADLVNSGLAQNRALGTLLRVERNRLMADGLTLASIDSLSGRGYTIAGRSSLIVAAGIAISIIILALFYGATRAPFPIYSGTFAGEKPTQQETP